MHGDTLPLALTIIGLLVAGCSARSTETDAAFSSSGQVIAMSGGAGGAQSACFGCHGLRGEGDGAAPRLAGLDAGYLHKQMVDYAARTRLDKVMSPISQRLDDAGRRAVADYYAGLTPQTSQGAGPPPGVYAAGDPARGIAACAVCHGGAGEGVGAAGPSIAGQPAAYIADQLQRYAKAERRNDPRGVMAAAARGLTVAERDQLAGWLQRQDASRRPDTGVASVRAAEVAAQTLAPSRGARRLDR